MELENLSVDKIKPYENNPKKHPDVQIELLKKVITEFGFQVPVIVDKNNVLIAGHGRLEAAKQLGLKELPAVRVENLSEEQIKAFRIADNRVAESEWNYTLLLEELRTLDERLLSLAGFSPDDIGKISEGFDVDKLYNKEENALANESVFKHELIFANEGEYQEFLNVSEIIKNKYNKSLSESLLMFIKEYL